MAQEVFARVEKKYLLSEEQYNAFLKALEPYMEMDEYGLHTIRNIYFDTENDDLVRTSNEKPVYKEKFRVRSYGIPEKGDAVFLEIKKKYKGVVYKRRITLSPDEAEQYLKDGKLPEKFREKPSQIFREIDYFLNFYHPYPKMYLAYDRIALFGKEDQEYRVTFDKNIRYRNENLTLDDDIGNTYLLEEGERVMEVKINRAMPLWFAKLLSDYEIRPVSLSKYGKAYLNNVKENLA